MFHLAVICVALVTVTAERVPCGRGPQVCAKRSQTSSLGNQVFCCGDDFSMHLGSTNVNGAQKTNCMCTRMFTETDCMEGRAQCQGASSFTNVGGVVKCCRDGQTMTSYHNTRVNGVMVDSCKCKANVAATTNMFSSSSGFLSHGMFNNMFQTHMSSMMSGIQHMMTSMNSMMLPSFGLFPSRQRQLRGQGQTPVGQGQPVTSANLLSPRYWMSRFFHQSAGGIPASQPVAQPVSAVNILNPSFWMAQLTGVPAVQPVQPAVQPAVLSQPPVYQSPVQESQPAVIPESQPAIQESQPAAVPESQAQPQQQGPIRIPTFKDIQL